MRLLLDANLSPKRIGVALEERGHDVLALASDATLSALDDPESWPWRPTSAASS